MEYLGTYLIIAAILLAFVFVKKSLVIIPQPETKIIERLGKFRAILKPVSTSSYPLWIKRKTS